MAPRTVSRLTHLRLEILEERLTPASFSGTEGNDTITVTHTATGNFLQVTVNGSVVSNDIPLAGIEPVTISGLGGNDTFNLNDLALWITFDGGDGTDALTVRGTAAGDDFEAGDTSAIFFNDQPVLTSNLEARSIDGGAGSDTIEAIDIANTWSLTGANAGQLNSLVSFTNAENVRGGSDNDTFLLSPNASLTGSLTGGDGSIDTLSYALYTRAITFNLAATSAPGLSNFAGIETVIGGAGSDTLVAENTPNSWSLTSANAGTVGFATFSSFENLTGGSDADTFVFGGAATVQGKIDGKTGTDTLNYANVGAAVTVNLATSVGTNVGKFTGIEAVVGSNFTDTIVGPNLANLWTISGNAGNVNNFAFSSIENLTGGTNKDSFATDAGGWSGLLDGKAGSDSLIETNQSFNNDTWIISGSGGTLDGSQFTGIETLQGGTNSDTLIGADVANTWNITGQNAGKLNSLNFSGMDNLTGGSDNDVFQIKPNASVTGQINGGSGKNSLSYLTWTTGVVVNLQLGSATATAGVSDLRNVVGGAGNDQLTGDTGDNMLMGVLGNDILIGGDGRDLLIGGRSADTLMGELGEDILIGGHVRFVKDFQGSINLNARNALLDEWARTDADYATRITHLRTGGGLNGNVKLNRTTMARDGFANSLTGGVDLDWFLTVPLDSEDHDTGETVTPI